MSEIEAELKKIEKMNLDQLRELSKTLKMEKTLSNTRTIDSLYPETGLLSRHNYVKHMEFFQAGKTHMERAAIAANRSGKTLMSCYETVLHLTGEYPGWWEGRRFERAVDWWAASVSGEATRDILQLKLMGPAGAYGTGLIPKKSLVGDPTHRRGIAEAVDTVKVKHVSGEISTLSFKSYDQGRDKFQGTKKDGIQLDEEPPADVYFEALTRLSATEPHEDDGLMICTFTPLSGMSAVVLMFLNDPDSTRFVLTMGMDHAPHLSEKTKKKLIASYPPHEREARINGTPQLGSGAIYPVSLDEILVNDFEVPIHWPLGYALDVGWNRTAAAWFALDRTNDIVYMTGEHYRGQAEPAIHADAIKARGAWIPGVIDPASKGRSQIDGQRLIEIYTKQFGLNLSPAKNSVESGIYQVWQRLSSGRLKVFRSCQNFQSEYKLYRRDEDGKIVKENDHLQDCVRYFIVSGLSIAKPKAPTPQPKIEMRSFTEDSGWME